MSARSRSRGGISRVHFRSYQRRPACLIIPGKRESAAFGERRKSVHLLGRQGINAFKLTCRQIIFKQRRAGALNDGHVSLSDRRFAAPKRGSECTRILIRHSLVVTPLLGVVGGFEPVHVILGPTSRPWIGHGTPWIPTEGASDCQESLPSRTTARVSYEIRFLGHATGHLYDKRHKFLPAHVREFTGYEPSPGTGK